MANESPEEILRPAKRSRELVRGRTAPGHFTIHPADWQSPVFDNAVVPAEDDPLRGWKGLGANRLSSELWPAYARHNPVLAYFTARRRGGLREDLFGLLPWGFLLVAQAMTFLLLATGRFTLLKWAGLALLAAPVASALWSGTMAGVHIRSALRALPLDELMTTPLTSESIVQGLSLRPLSVQAFAHVVVVLAGMVLAIAGEAILYGVPGTGAFFYCALFSPLIWAFLFAGNELGGAFGTRAHFCIRDPGEATMRMLLDLLRECFLPVIGVPLAFVVVFLAGYAFFGSYVVYTFVAFGGILVFSLIAAPFLLMSLLRSHSTEAMQWTCAHPEEWWINEPNGEYRLGAGRTVWQPWDHLVEIPLGEKSSRLPSREGGRG